MHRRIFLSLMLAVPWAAQAQRQTKPAFKGMELYSWSYGQAWSYAILVGTNRNKVWDEIRAAAMDETALLAKLGQLALGENVCWTLGCQGLPAHKLELPPDSQLAKIQERCLHLEIHLYVPKQKS